jgi:hypothetical protein
MSGIRPCPRPPNRRSNAAQLEVSFRSISPNSRAMRLTEVTCRPRKAAILDALIRRFARLFNRWFFFLGPRLGRCHFLQRDTPRPPRLAASFICGPLRAKSKPRIGLSNAVIQRAARDRGLASWLAGHMPDAPFQSLPKRMGDVAILALEDFNR